MDKVERERLEADLTEQLGINVIIDKNAPEGIILLCNMSDDPRWKHEVKEWVVLPVGAVSITNAYTNEAVKNAIQENLKQMKSKPPMSLDNLMSDVNLKSTD